MLYKLKILRYENPIMLLAIILVTIFLIGGIVFGIYKLVFDGRDLPTVGGNGAVVEDVKETTITKETVRVPQTLEGTKITPEMFEEANKTMTDEGAYEGSYDETIVPNKDDLYMEGAAVDPYVDESTAGKEVGVYGEKSQKETVKLIQKKISSTPENTWLGRALTDKEKDILSKIEADPKNCYPEFNSVENFQYTEQGYSFSFYSNFITNVLMYGGDASNFGVNIY